MNCVNPLVLKNGCVVPCGKCELCLSHRRQEWSVRVQLHAASYERMPLFITLTYDDKHIPYRDIKNPDVWYSQAAIDELPELEKYASTSLRRSDLTKFIKAYKMRYELSNTDFSYFGCGEYGDKFGRPHYHLIVFGDDELYDLYDKDSDLASKRVFDVWKKGHVHVCVASWAGIHYVTKYVLKENPEDWQGYVDKPFTCVSHGIGLNWLNTREADKLRSQLCRLTAWQDEFNESLQSVPFDSSDLYSWRSAISKALADSHISFPDFRVMLPSGKRVSLPRDIRRRLVGSFEHFKDNPLWLYNHFKTLLDSLDYYINYKNYDDVHELPMSLQQSLSRVDKIRQRLIINKHKNK